MCKGQQAHTSASRLSVSVALIQGLVEDQPCTECIVRSTNWRASCRASGLACSSDTLKKMASPVVRNCDSFSLQASTRMLSAAAG